MNVSLNIDVANAKHRQALNDFMQALSDEAVVTVAPSPKISTADAKKSTPTEPEEETEEEQEDQAKKARQARAQARKAKAKVVEPEPEDEDEEEEDFLGDEDTEEEQEITPAMLRTLTAEKSVEYRAEIKKKLTSYGVSNVTSIPEDKMKDYHKFITSL